MEIRDGKLVFTTDYLRSIKRNLISPETVSVYRGKCSVKKGRRKLNTLGLSFKRGAAAILGCWLISAE